MPPTTLSRLGAAARHGGRAIRGALVAAGLLASAIDPGPAAAPGDAAPPPSLLETGLYRAGTLQVDPAHLAFAPQYPLWSDGAVKRRWMALPAGTAIDATLPDAWDFPRGTRLWKEFSHGAAVETRFIERLNDGSWRYATYVWQPDGRDARLAPAGGMTVSVAAAPAGRYRIPGQIDCRSCHEGAAVPVLGVGTLQLSADRDAGAPHAHMESASADLQQLVRRGWLRNLPPTLLEQAPRIAARSPLERSALGYLHANCGHCHNDNGAPAPVRLTLAQQTGIDPMDSSTRVLQSLLDRPSRFQPSGATKPARLIEPGNAAASVLLQRLSTRNPQQQMPPIGTSEPDAAAIALIGRWIDHELHTRKETTR